MRKPRSGKLALTKRATALLADIVSDVHELSGRFAQLQVKVSTFEALTKTTASAPQRDRSERVAELVRSFAETELVSDPGGRVTVRATYRAFEAWCRLANTEPPALVPFGQAIVDWRCEQQPDVKRGELVARAWRTGKSRVRGYAGLRLRGAGDAQAELEEFARTGA